MDVGVPVMGKLGLLDQTQEKKNSNNWLKH